MPCFQGLQYLAVSFLVIFLKKGALNGHPTWVSFFASVFCFSWMKMLVVSKKKSSGIRNIWRWIPAYGRCLAQVVCVLLNFLGEDEGWLGESDMKFHLRHVYCVLFLQKKDWFSFFTWICLFRVILYVIYQHLRPFVRILFLKILSNHSPIVIGSVNRKMSCLSSKVLISRLRFKMMGFIHLVVEWSLAEWSTIIVPFIMPHS